MRPSLRERFAAPRGKRLTNIHSLQPEKRVRRNRQGTARAEANTAQTSDELPKRKWRTALVHKQRVKTPNDPKLSDGGAWRGSCEGEAQRAAADVGQSHDRTRRARVRTAATVTRGTVRCSAWLGVALAAEMAWSKSGEKRGLGKDKLPPLAVACAPQRQATPESKLGRMK